MFRAEQRTDGDRQRRRSPAPCRDHPADGSRRGPRTAKTGGNRQTRGRKRTKCKRTCKNRNICLHIRTICKGKHPGGGRIPCKIRRKWPPPPPPGRPRTATRGGGLQIGRAKPFLPATQLSPPPKCSPYRSNIRAISLSPPLSHVPHSGTPIRVSQASYRQVRGRGGGFETGSKKRNGQRPRSKIKISAGASAIYVRGRYGLSAALMRGWRHGVDTDVIWG